MSVIKVFYIHSWSFSKIFTYHNPGLQLNVATISENCLFVLICLHTPFSYKTTSFEKDQSIAYIYISKAFTTMHFLLVLILMNAFLFGSVKISKPCYCGVRSCGKKNETRCVHILFILLYQMNFRYVLLTSFC